MKMKHFALATMMAFTLNASAPALMSMEVRAASQDETLNKVLESIGKIFDLKIKSSLQLSKNRDKLIAGLKKAGMSPFVLELPPSDLYEVMQFIDPFGDIIKLVKDMMKAKKIPADVVEKFFIGRMDAVQRYYAEFSQ